MERRRITSVQWKEKIFFPLRRLRWKIIGGHMLVVIVGVMTLSLVSEVIMLRAIPDQVHPYLAALTQADTSDSIERTTSDLLQSFYRDAVSRSLMIAALSAILTGLLTSLFLAREILRPLQQLVTSSQRIANGRYNERINVPGSLELASVAIHFNQMAEALEQIEQQRVALIGNVSHELRTPLTGIEGYLEGMMDGLFPKNDETFAQMFQEVRRLRRLVDDLQALSKVEAGQIPLHLSEFDLIPLVERIVGQLQPQAVAQNIEITTDTPKQLYVYADPDRTAQVALNLLGNAIRYTPEGGFIWLQVTTGLRLAEIIVQDSGIGIPGEALPYVFERFYRVDPSRARQSGGSGIGLTISRHLAWAMGGELTADSAGTGQGSAFRFCLPQVQQPDRQTI